MENDDSVDVRSICRENAKYLKKIGNFLSISCPPASRLFMSNVLKIAQDFPELLKKEEKNSHNYCHYCGSLFNFESCQIRMVPRQHANQHIKKLLQMEKSEQWKLNKRQKHKLRKYHSSVGKIIFRCLVCKKATSFPGTKRRCGQTPRSTSTPLSKIKIKKGSINAGLFIASPATVIKEKNVSEELQISKEIPNIESRESPGDKSFSIAQTSLGVSKDTSKNTNILSRYQITPTSTKPLLESNCKKKSSVKKKNTLLAQILDQEQNKKKKTSLSSFLVAL